MEEKGFSPEDIKDLPEGMEIEVPTIDGKTLKLEQWLCFQAYCLEGVRTSKDIVKKMAEIGYDIPLSTLVKWTRSDWWMALRDFHVTFLQENFYIGLFKELPKLKDAIVDIWEGKWPEEDRNATAIMASFREIVRMAKGKVEPLSTLKHDYEFKIKKTETIKHEHIVRILPYMTDEETRVFGRTGDIPDRLSNLLENQIIELTPESVTRIDSAEDGD